MINVLPCLRNVFVQVARVWVVTGVHVACDEAWFHCCIFFSFDCDVMLHSSLYLPAFDACWLSAASPFLLFLFFSSSLLTTAMASYLDEHVFGAIKKTDYRGLYTEAAFGHWWSLFALLSSDFGHLLHLWAALNEPHRHEAVKENPYLCIYSF